MNDRAFIRKFWDMEVNTVGVISDSSVSYMYDMMKGIGIKRRR
jgi:hypothetical protein